MKRLTGIAMAVCLCLCGQTILAQDAGPGGPEGGPAGRPTWQGRAMGPEADFQGALINRIINNPDIGIALKIGLTEDQVKMLREKNDELRAAGIQLRADSELAAMAQAKLLTQDKVPEAELMSAVEKSGKINTEIAKLKVRQVLLLKNTLTAEQMGKLKEVARERIGKRMTEGDRPRPKHEEGIEPGVKGKAKPDGRRGGLQKHKRGSGDAEEGDTQDKPAPGQLPPEGNE